MSTVIPFTKRFSGPQELQIRSRFETCIDLEGGHAAFPLTRVDPLYEEQPGAFSFNGRPPSVVAPSEWLVLAIRRLANAVREQKLDARPIHLPTPAAILLDPNAVSLALATVNDEGFCAQEFMLEIQDASLAASDKDSLDNFDAFRRAGFRIALDARKSCVTAFSARIRPAIERLRVTSTDLLDNETVQLRADIVGCLGGEIIVERANWREADMLRNYGATHALKLLSDA